jgi:metal-sulfur cluster biosynthetic enzyme
MDENTALIYDALKRVYDPCSVLNGTHLNIVEMGLIREVQQHGNTLQVRLLLTDPSCIYTFEIARMVKEELLLLPGVQNVEVESTSDTLWTQERMLPETRERLHQRRMTYIEKHHIVARGRPKDHATF